jgi:hypothetical protein
MQTRLQSLIESSTDIVIGFVLSMLFGLIVYPLHGAEFNFCTNLAITAEFTALGLARRFAVRRWFNGRK